MTRNRLQRQALGLGPSCVTLKSKLLALSVPQFPQLRSGDVVSCRELTRVSLLVRAVCLVSVHPVSSLASQDEYGLQVRDIFEQIHKAACSAQYEFPAHLWALF